MASLKCSKCGYGIHYHDEPNGIEWVAFEIDTWNELCVSTKLISSYEMDRKSGWYTIWKCEECGTLHIFKAMNIHLDKVYELQNIAEFKAPKESIIDCIAFEDITWDQITESEKTGNDFDLRFKKYPRKYIRFSNDLLCVYVDAEFSQLEKVYKLLDVRDNIV